MSKTATAIASNSPMTTAPNSAASCVPLYTESIPSPAPILQAFTEIAIPIHNKGFTGFRNFYRNMVKIAQHCS